MFKLIFFLLIFSISVQGIEYQGNHNICFLDNRNNETCINSTQNFTTNSTFDYIIKLNYLDYEKSTENFLDDSEFMNVKYVGYSMIILSIIVLIILFFKSYFNL